MRKTRLKRVSPSVADRRAEADRFHADANGVYFYEANGLLPKSVSDFPRIRDIKREEVCAFMHARYGHLPCWLCGHYGTIEAHHIVPRWDILANIIMACRGCHARVQDSPKALPEVLLAKLQNDPLHTDWLLIGILRRKKYSFDSLVPNVA